jgi:hypothetical protein
VALRLLYLIFVRLCGYPANNLVSRIERC